MSEGNTSIAKPHLEVLAYSAVNKNLPHVTNNWNNLNVYELLVS